MEYVGVPLSNIQPSIHTHIRSVANSYDAHAHRLPYKEFGVGWKIPYPHRRLYYCAALLTCMRVRETHRSSRRVCMTSLGAVHISIHFTHAYYTFFGAKFATRHFIHNSIARSSVYLWQRYAELNAWFTIYEYRVAEP